MMPIELIYGVVAILLTTFFCFVGVRSMSLFGIFIGGFVSMIILFAVHYGLLIVIGG